MTVLVRMQWWCGPETVEPATVVDAWCRHCRRQLVATVAAATGGAWDKQRAAPRRPLLRPYRHTLRRWQLVAGVLAAADARRRLERVISRLARPTSVLVCVDAISRKRSHQLVMLARQQAKAALRPPPRATAARRRQLPHNHQQQHHNQQQHQQHPHQQQLSRRAAALALLLAAPAAALPAPAAHAKAASPTAAGDNLFALTDAQVDQRRKK